MISNLHIALFFILSFIDPLPWRPDLYLLCHAVRSCEDVGIHVDFTTLRFSDFENRHFSALNSNIKKNADGGGANHDVSISINISVIQGCGKERLAFSPQCPSHLSMVIIFLFPGMAVPPDLFLCRGVCGIHHDAPVLGIQPNMGVQKWCTPKTGSLPYD